MTTVFQVPLRHYITPGIGKRCYTSSLCAQVIKNSTKYALYAYLIIKHKKSSKYHQVLSATLRNYLSIITL